jgi:hypothetical protein
LLGGGARRLVQTNGEIEVIQDPIQLAIAPVEHQIADADVTMESFSLLNEPTITYTE